MTKLSDDARAVVDRFIEASTPPPGAAEAAWDRLGSALTTVPGAVPGAQALAHGAWATSSATLKVALGGLVAAAVGGGVSGWFWAQRALDAETVAVEPIEPSLAEAPPTTNTTLAVTPPTIPLSVVPEREPGPRTSLRPRARPGAAIRRVPATAEAPEATPPASAEAEAIAAEMKLVSGARVAIRRGRPDEALRLAREHRDRFPGGGMIEERMVVEVDALCGLGRTAEATETAARFRDRFPRSPARRRMTTPCAK